MRLVGARVAGNALQIAVGQQALRERTEGDAADALIAENIEQPVFNPAVEHGVLRLMNQAGRAQIAQNFRGNGGLLRIIAGDAGVECLAGAHGVIERAHGLFDRRGGIRPVRVEDVDVFEAHALEALVEAGQQIFA